jgi:hypothetical protein
MTLNVMAGGMDSPYSTSQASMWTQGFQVVKVAFDSYHVDQGREHPLVSSRRYTSKTAKDCDPAMMKRLLDDVSDVYV